MNCVETIDLTFGYSKHETIINNLNLKIENGVIYGFLGPNGAGKTTTLKLILGILKGKQGRIKIFDQELANNRVKILSKVGCLLETPSIYSHLTAFENLKVWGNLYPCPKKRIDEVLEIVGLTDAKNKKAGAFSLGMKQRLGIGISLLNEPGVLILDEPSNGLDPNGILDLRLMLKRINNTDKTTIILSSHLLAEIEKTVSHVGIISKGALLFQGTLAELQLKQKQSAYLVIETNNLARAMEVISANNIQPALLNGKLTIPAVGNEIISNLNKQLIDNQVEVHQITIVKNDLESTFIELTKN
jgi:ABC-2 type transport system ATP-binding protein